MFLRNDSDCKDVDLYNKSYAVIESSDPMRNTSWLASCFSKIKEPISKKSKGILILRTISLYNTISRHNQKTDTTAQMYCTLSMYVTQKTISRQNQKTNTMPQLYCTLDT